MKHNANKKGKFRTLGIYRFISELRRRRVFRTAAGYAVFAWLILQIADVTFDPMELPSWAMQILMIVLFIGFPVALMFSWFFRVSPKGIFLDIGSDGPTRSLSTGELALVVLLTLITLVFSVPIGQMALESIGESGHRFADAGKFPSIAVIPFANLGDDKSDEYFSDGLAEEILNKLARLNSLHVVARTSSFAFKGKNADVRSIAGELGVRYLLEGSVRRAGEDVRISAKLIDGSNGFELWSNRFDTVMRDIFRVQDDIANAIVTALMPTLVQTSEPIFDTRPPTSSQAAYDHYLRARFHLNRREELHLWRAIDLFQSAIEADPGFGRAYIGLAYAYVLLPSYSIELEEDMFPLALDAIAEGIAHDAAVADMALAVTANIKFRRWQWSEAEADFVAALERNPNDPVAHQWYSQMLGAVGRRAEAYELALQAHELDKKSPVAKSRVAVSSLWIGETVVATEFFEAAHDLGLETSLNLEAFVLLLLRKNEFGRAANIAERLQRMFQQSTDWIEPVMVALRDNSARLEAIAAVESAIESFNLRERIQLGLWAMLDEPERSLDVAFLMLNDRTNFEVEFLFADEMAQVRQSPRFAELLEAIGLPEYWDATEWPNLCKRINHEISCK